MNYNFEKIHEEILEKSLKYRYIKNQILINQVLKLEKTKLDLFSFVMKSIISQQISDKAADTIWKRYCFHFENNNMKIKNITDKKKFSYSLDFLQISKRKKKYIYLFYEAYMKDELKNIDLMNDDEIKKKLCSYIGIGNWTADMALMFFFRKPNIFPLNDLIIKKVTKKLSILENQEIDFKKIFSPHLTFFSLHLWKMSKRII